MNLRELARERPAEGRPEPSTIPHTTARESWSWIGPLGLGMLTPFGLATALYARFLGGGPASVGLTRAHVGRDVALGAAIGIPMAGLAAATRGWAVPGYRRHTAADQMLQSAFFMGVNAPVEELFWRGMVQHLAIQGAGRVLGKGARATTAGWALATLGFGAFHTLGGDWPWRAVVGATAGGGIFGLVYALQPEPRSILPSILVHGCATAGLFNWGDVLLDQRARRARRLRRARGHDV